MQNTKVEHSSLDRMPVILPEMEQLLPPLSAEQFSALERDIWENGCYAPVIVNEDMVIVDGHNRFRICEKYALPFQMLVFSFADLLEAKQWALDTQKGRRNLDKWELGKIALKLRGDVEARAKKNMSLGGQVSRPSGGVEEGMTTLSNLPAVNTRKELAAAVGIGEVTMGKVMQIDEHAPTAIREALDSGELSISQGYDLTRQLRDVPAEERDEAAAQMIELVRARKEICQLDAEADRRGKIARLFCKAFERAMQLTPTEENVRYWVEGARMRTDEIENSAKDAEKLSEVFADIAGILRTMLPIKVG